MGEPTQTIIGRYALFDEIASGGMATVHMGRLLGAAGFSRMVAIKRLHRQYAKDPAFVSMFIDEARLAARIRHPNVVPTLDVVQTDDELFLVMEYVSGDSLARLLERSRELEQRVEPDIAVAVAAGMLHGLHAAHTATGERGEPLQIVHRDVSPQNVMVGTDGTPRVLDFGIAKATVRLQTTRDGQIKGKLAYMAPEQLAGGEVRPATDVYAASLVLWEALAGKRLFQAEHEAALLALVIGGADEPPSTYEPDTPPELDEIVMRGLAANPEDRFATAREMAQALEKAVPPASSADVGEWVEQLADQALSSRAARISIIESDSEVQAAAALARTIGDSSSTDAADPESATRVSAQHSQASSISVARSQSGQRSAARQKRVRMLGLAALALVAGGALAVFVLGA
ncbi:MAG: serine/threonine protein kinase, partial [Deltaproteobacteria bacterium]|nr:serine/threonine protein kinase [Deltaproteobacteria bacterium]MBW2535104.1 serine/threonine protein kinase [Deltaproteobacteria bacterium]